MATTARQPKPPRKGMAEPAARRPSAWTAGARASPTFSPGMPNARLPTGPQAPNSGGFPPLGQSNGAPRNNTPQDRVLQQLSGLTGTTITLSTKTGIRYEGVIGSTNSEGDTTGVTLKDVKEISNPGAPLKDSFFIASTNIDTWASGPADAKAPNGDSFKTDIDISKKLGQPRERELKAWSDDIPAAVENAASGASGRFGHDDLTFGPGASQGSQNWDQFAANEKLFGVKAGFDEEAYTTKIDRSAPDFKEKEKKATAIANEIMAAATNNVHVAEERVMNFAGGEGTNEEEKFSAVVRGANAYVPPGARKAQQAQQGQQNATNTNGVTPPSKLDLPKVSVNAPEGSNTAPAKPELPVPKVASPAPAGAGNNTPTTADPVPAFRNFVSTERDRLMKKKQALMKNEMDKRMAELVKFSQTFKLNKPMPDDLVPILAKDEDKQRLIKEKSAKDAQSTSARSIGASSTAPAAALPPALRLTTTPGGVKPSVSPQPAAAKSPVLSKAASNAGAPAAKEGTPGKRIPMIIQPIPPFKGKKTSASGAPTAPGAASSTANGSAASAAASRTSSTSGNAPSTPLSPTASNRLNVNASSFRPNVKANAFAPSGSQLNGSNSASASPKPKPAEANSSQSQGPPNPFFGNRVIKKVPPVHIKEDFNPFKYHKVADAAQVSATWPYNGKRYTQMFPPLPQQAPPQSPHMGPPVPPPPMPPPTFEDSSDPAAQQAAAAARGFVYAYPYPYPGQPMMPGMPPPPPPGYMPGPYMQPIPYPHMPPPNAMYPGTPMGQMPPPGAYMAPPGAYPPPPPNGSGPRPSMPPTPIPQHAHPYYQQSPQLGHAIPYPMMMPPPGAPGAPGVPAPHPYEGAPAPPVAMGGVGHA